MRKLTLVGSGCLVLVGAAVFVATRFPIGCLFAPCDRSVQFILQPPEQALADCDLLLFAPGDEALSEPLHRLAIEDHQAEVIVQPSWRESFLVALRCKGSPLSRPQLVDYEHKSSVSLTFQRPGPAGRLILPE